MILEPIRPNPIAIRARIIAILPAIAALALAPGALAAPGWDLDRVLAAVRANDPRVEAARSGGDAERAQGSSTRLSISPRVSLRGGAVRSDDPALLFSEKLWQGRFTADDFALDRLNDPSARTSLDYGLTLEQPIWNGGAELTSFAETSHRHRAADAREASRVSQRLLEAVQTYADAIQARETLAADSTARDAAFEQRRAAADLFRRGQVPELDTLRAFAHWAEADAAWRTARSDYAVALLRLSQRVGAGVAPDSLEGPPPDTGVPEPEGDAAGSFDVKAAREDASVAGIRAQRAGWSLLPSLNGRADVRYYRDADLGDFKRRWTAAIVFDLPLWDGAKRWEEWRAARARAGEARARAEAARQDWTADVAAARSEATLARERRDAAAKARAAAEEALRLASGRYRAGLLPLGDLLTVDAEAARARLNDVAGRVGVLLADTRYRHAMGSLR
ncbi:MAG: TolC family protein [Hyphomicrobiales bacterium]